nr:P2Y purinoceptor 11-like [Chelonoidis abingdonii]
MEPFTASTLQVRKKNSLKDFVAVAGPLGVTHFLVFTKSPTNVNFKLVRLPGGPTLTFKVTQYSLIKDVVSSLKRHRMHEQQFTHHPLLVLNNFGLQQMHIKLMATMFQNMFPSINVHKVNLNAIKRCLLISYNAHSQLLDFRHYSLKVVPVGASKGLKKLLQEKFPNMSRLEDISELLAKMAVTGPAGQGACNASFNAFQEHMWPVLTVEFFLAFGGNAFAIYRFVAHERSWHTGIVYSFNLAVSDLLYALSLPFLAAYYYPPKHWRYGLALCKLERFLFSCNLYGSIFFLTCISVNRYLGIVHPLLVHGRLEPRHAKLLSGATWLLVAGLSAPTLHFSALQPRGNCTECLGSATDEQLPQYLPYSLFLAAVGCGLPFLLTLLSYAAILRTVCRNPHITRLEKRKVGRLVSVGVALYAVSYLPYHTLRNLNLHLRQRYLQDGHLNFQHALPIHSAYQLSKILVTLNICAHPLLYSALADSMRGWCRAPHGQDRDQPAENMKLQVQG